MLVIGMHLTMVLKVNTIGKYAAENGKAAALNGSRPRMTSEKALCDYSRSTTGSVQKSHSECGQTECVQTQVFNAQSTLKPLNAVLL